MQSKSFNLTFSLDNDAFRNEDGSIKWGEINLTLLEVTNQMPDNYQSSDPVKIRDTNGNTVGQWQIKREDNHMFPYRLEDDQASLAAEWESGESSALRELTDGIIFKRETAESAVKELDKIIAGIDDGSRDGLGDYDALQALRDELQSLIS